jgi:hypothetical protein
MLSYHYPNLSCFTKKKFDKTITLAATRRSLCHVSPTFSRPTLATKSHFRQKDYWTSSARLLGWSHILRMQFSSTTPAPQVNSDALVRKLSPVEILDATSTRPNNRFDWRLRASSRMRTKDGKISAEQRKPPLRRRLQVGEPDLAGPFYQAFQDYNDRSV